jgi:HK97 family phage major capsid protein
LKNAIQFELDTLLAKRDLSSSDRKKADILLAKQSAIRAGEVVDSEVRSAMRHFLMTGEVRSAMGVGAGEAGSTFVPQGFEDKIKAMSLASGPFYFGSPFVSNIGPTKNGAPMAQPVLDDLTNTGQVQTADNTQITQASPTVARALYGAQSFSSGIVLASIELIQDCFESIENALFGSLSSRLSRIQNATFLASLYTALAANSSASVAAAGGSPVYNDIVGLVASVNASYRASEQAAFVFNSSTGLVLSKIEDDQHRPVFRHVLDPQPTLLGYPVVYCDYMDSIASGKNPIMFGDLSYVGIRGVGGPVLQTLRERYSDYGQVGTILKQRADVQFLSATASESPVKMLHFS